MNKLIDLNDAPCSVCKAEFLKTDLDEVGRCKVCAERNLQPGFKTEQEFVQKDTLSKDKIKEIIKEVLAELRAEESEADDLSEDGVTYKSKKCEVWKRFCSACSCCQSL